MNFNRRNIIRGAWCLVMLLTGALLIHGIKWNMAKTGELSSNTYEKTIELEPAEAKGNVESYLPEFTYFKILTLRESYSAGSFLNIHSTIDTLEEK